MPVSAEKSLHKGLGVRRPDLFEIRASDLGSCLFIDPEDEPPVVLAKVLWQVRNAIEQVTTDPKKREFLRVGYNLPRDAELNSLNLEERLALLGRRRGRGWAANTSNKVLPSLVKAVVRHWYVKPGPAPAEAIDELLQAEADFARTKVGDTTIVAPADFFMQLIKDSNSARPRLLERLLPQQELHFEITAESHLVTVKTTDLGEYLCVFTSPDLLDTYVQQVGAELGGHRAALPGGKGVDLLAQFPDVGLALNPVVGGETRAQWTASEVAERWPAERRGQEV